MLILYADYKFFKFNLARTSKLGHVGEKEENEKTGYINNKCADELRREVERKKVAKA